MESSLRLGSMRICFENGNLISLISNKSSHLEGMAPTLQWGSRIHRGRVKFVFEVNGIYRGNSGLFQAVFVLKRQHVYSSKNLPPECWIRYWQLHDFFRLLVTCSNCTFVAVIYQNKIVDSPFKGVTLCFLWFYVLLRCWISMPNIVKAPKLSWD